MPNVRSSVILGAALSWITAAAVGVAEAQNYYYSVPASLCAAAKVKAAGTSLSRRLQCHATHSRRPDAAKRDACLAKRSAAFDEPAKGPFDKADARGDDCLTDGDQAAFDDRIAGIASDLVGVLGAGKSASPCDARRLQCFGKYLAGVTKCVFETARATGNTVDQVCLNAATLKFTTFDGEGCYDQAEGSCSNGTTPASALVAANPRIRAAICALLPGTNPCPTVTPTPTPPRTPTPTVTPQGPPVCGNGTIESGEYCDPPGVGTCGPGFACNACTCGCPTRLRFATSVGVPEARLDLGWTGIGFGAPLPLGSGLWTSLSCGSSLRPCGTCAITGALAGTGAGELHNQRCSNDSSISCSDDTPCLAGGGSCRLYYGPPLSLYVGGVPACVVSQIVGPVSGTADLEIGALSVALDLSSRFWAGSYVDPPCPRCAGDPTPNDGLAAGSCSEGARAGLPCDGNAEVPGRPDFGVTSLDCPVETAPFSNADGTWSVPLQLATATQVRTLTSTSPACSGEAPERCFCDTCNNPNQEVCDDHADCPDPAGPIAAICGGRRCMGGTNTGAACSNGTECPGGACGRPGDPTHPNGCIDTSDLPDLCLDTSPSGDGLGECMAFLPTGKCTRHAQRSCSSDNDCCDDTPACTVDPIVPGDCVIGNRPCFLDNGVVGGQLTAPATADYPLADTWSPTLASIFCLGPSASPALNIATGLPGPGRAVMRVDANAYP